MAKVENSKYQTGEVEDQPLHCPCCGRDYFPDERRHENDALFMALSFIIGFFLGLVLK
jgi:hypothetical protein